MPPMKRPAPQDGSGSLTLVTLARRWHVPRRTVRRLLQQGELPFEEVDGRLRVPMTAVRHYEQSRDALVRSGQRRATVMRDMGRPGR